MSINAEAKQPELLEVIQKVLKDSIVDMANEEMKKAEKLMLENIEKRKADVIASIVFRVFEHVRVRDMGSSIVIEVIKTNEPK